MNEIRQDLNLVEFMTQYDVRHSTFLLESVRQLINDPKSSKEAVTFLNSRLTNVSSKNIGFALLAQLLPDCSQQVLESNAKSWITHALSKHHSESMAPCRFQCIVELLHRLHAHQEFHKDVVTNLMPMIMDTCIWVHVKSANAEHSLNLLYYTMKYFASTCVTYKRKIEEYVECFLDIPCKIATTCAAAKCFHALNQIGGAGPNGCEHNKNFETSFEKLYNALSVLYNAMFENVNEFREIAPVEDESKVLKFTPLPTYLGTIDVYKILSRRMGTVVIFLIEMLQTEYNAKKIIKPGAILKVIQRGLDIHVHGDENDLNRINFNQCIQEHQIKLMFLLKALIQSLQHQFMRHMGLNMLVRYLSRASDCDCYKTNSAYKSAIYEVITFWLERSGEQMDAKALQKLVEIIIQDIVPTKTTLIIRADKSKHIQPHMPQIQDSPRVQSTLTANCIGALKLLECLLNHNYFNITKTMCTQLFDVIISTLLDICVNIYTFPYTSKCNRLQLFNVLIAVFNQQVHCIDINLAANILHHGRHSGCNEQSMICSKGLSVIEKLVHPTHPTLQHTTAKSNLNAEESAKDTKENSVIVKVLSNLIIHPELSAEQELSITSVTDDDHPSKSSEDIITKESEDITTLNENHNERVRNNVDVFEIESDHEIESEDNEEPDVTILDQDDYRTPSKRRKAEGKDIICTFDISEDPLEIM